MATFYIGASANDGDKRSGGAWTYTENDIESGDSLGTHTVGLRFSGVGIIQGSTINSAILKGYTAGVSGQSGSEIVRIKIYGIDEDQTADFTSDPTGRPKTTANADWDFEPSVSISSQTSGSIVSLVQEIVDRGGWSSGNEMGFLLEDDGSDTVAQVWYAYNGDPTKDFELTVTWTTPASTSSTTSTSTSTSTTSTSTSTSSSTTTQIPDPNYAQGIMRITKEGKEVIDSNYLDDFFLDSDYPLLKVHDYGSFTTNIIGTKEIAHSLGYIPYAMVFSQYIEDDGFGDISLTSEYYQHDWFLNGAAYYSYGYTKIYDDKLDITIENINTPRPGTINGFYYIFVEEIT